MGKEEDILIFLQTFLEVINRSNEAQLKVFLSHMERLWSEKLSESSDKKVWTERLSSDYTNAGEISDVGTPEEVNVRKRKFAAEFCTKMADSYDLRFNEQTQLFEPE